MTDRKLDTVRNTLKNFFWRKCASPFLQAWEQMSISCKFLWQLGAICICISPVMASVTNTVLSCFLHYLNLPHIWMISLWSWLFAQDLHWGCFNNVEVISINTFVNESHLFTQGKTIATTCTTTARESSIYYTNESHVMFLNMYYLLMNWQ